MRTTLFLLAIVTGLFGSGCRFLSAGREPAADQTTALGRSARPRSPAHTMLLELLFIRCPSDDQALHQELWGFVDEQFLDSGLRGRLAANGLRVGIVSGQLPTHLADRFTGTVTADDATGAQPLATEAMVTRRQLRLLPGRRSEIVTSSSLAELVLLEQTAEGVSGGTYRDASPLLAVVARPAADGRVSLEAVPEIRHGPVEKSWVGEDGMFRLETGQKRHRMEHLRVTATLPADSMLVLGCAGDETATVGDRLLRDHDRSGGTGLRLLVIRPLIATIDPLFTAADPREHLANEEPPLVVH
jgi:hypothetical protein